MATVPMLQFGFQRLQPQLAWLCINLMPKAAKKEKPVPETKPARAKKGKMVAAEADMPPCKKQKVDGDEAPCEGSASSDSHQVLMLAATKL